MRPYLAELKASPIARTLDICGLKFLLCTCSGSGSLKYVKTQNRRWHYGGKWANTHVNTGPNNDHVEYMFNDYISYEKFLEVSEAISCDPNLEVWAEVTFQYDLITVEDLTQVSEVEPNVARVKFYCWVRQPLSHQQQDGIKKWAREQKVKAEKERQARIKREEREKKRKERQAALAATKVGKKTALDVESALAILRAADYDVTLRSRSERPRFVPEPKLG